MSESVVAGTADATAMMDDFASETDSDYTSYWRDWVGCACFIFSNCVAFSKVDFHFKFVLKVGPSHGEETDRQWRQKFLRTILNSAGGKIRFV